MLIRVVNISNSVVLTVSASALSSTIGDLFLGPFRLVLLMRNLSTPNFSSGKESTFRIFLSSHLRAWIMPFILVISISPNVFDWIAAIVFGRVGDREMSICEVSVFEVGVCEVERDGY